MPRQVYILSDFSEFIIAQKKRLQKFQGDVSMVGSVTESQAREKALEGLFIKQLSVSVRVYFLHFSFPMLKNKAQQIY